MRRRLSALLVAVVIVCGVLGQMATGLKVVGIVNPFTLCGGEAVTTNSFEHSDCKSRTEHTLSVVCAAQPCLKENTAPPLPIGYLDLVRLYVDVNKEIYRPARCQRDRGKPAPSLSLQIISNPLCQGGIVVKKGENSGSKTSLNDRIIPSICVDSFNSYAQFSGFVSSYRTNLIYLDFKPASRRLIGDCIGILHGFSRLASVGERFASGQQGASNIDERPYSDASSDDAYYYHPHGPDRHVPLSVQILLGLIGFASGCALFFKAFRQQTARSTDADGLLVMLGFALIMGGALSVATGVVYPSVG